MINSNNLESKLKQSLSENEEALKNSDVSLSDYRSGYLNAISDLMDIIDEEMEGE